MRIAALVASYKRELMAEAEAANRLAADLKLLVSTGSFPARALREAPTFIDAFYIPKTVHVCMGSLKADSGTRGELVHTEEIVVDGKHHGWVLTRKGLYRMERHLGMY